MVVARLSPRGCLLPAGPALSDEQLLGLTSRRRRAVPPALPSGRMSGFSAKDINRPLLGSVQSGGSADAAPSTAWRAPPARTSSIPDKSAGSPVGGRIGAPEPSRWWVLFVYSYISALQSLLWITWSSVPTASAAFLCESSSPPGNVDSCDTSATTLDIFLFEVSALRCAGAAVPSLSA